MRTRVRTAAVIEHLMTPLNLLYSDLNVQYQLNNYIDIETLQYNFHIHTIESTIILSITYKDVNIQSLYTDLIRQNVQTTTYKDQTESVESVAANILNLIKPLIDREQ